jgi:hypothetical protein
MKTLKLLFWLGFLGSIVYVCWSVLPPYIANYQFEDAIEETSRMSSVPGRPSTDEQIKDSLLKDAHKLELPVTAEQIQIRRDGDDVAISADYTVHVDLPVYPLDLQFHPRSKNRPVLTR